MHPDAHNKLKALKKVRQEQKDQVQEISSDLNRTDWLAKSESEIDKLLDGMDAKSLDELIRGLPESTSQSDRSNASDNSDETTLPLKKVSENGARNMSQLDDSTNSSSTPSASKLSTSPKKSDTDGLGKSLASAGESVLAIGVLCGFGAWGGFQLDQHFHTAPWLAVSLSMLGLVGGLARMVMQALKSER